ncbi:MAG: NADH-quinone oxidoreductase subunit C [Actinobacteria bacterium]|nr:NADH-quinone oxidoreductase subunit C [Actinomycetota bacterium]
MSPASFDQGTPAGRVLAGLAERFPAVEWAAPLGDPVARVAREGLVTFAAAARDAGLDTFIDLCAVDYLARPAGRFEVVVHLLSMEPPLRLRILVALAGDDPSLPSLTGVFPGANFYEREAYDLFGVRFDGHPDLTRLLLPDEWEGHPLRKDHPVGAVPVQFKALEPQ